MHLTLKKIINNVEIRDLFYNGAYIYNFENKYIYKTLDFDNSIWESSDIVGSIIQNGNSEIISIGNSQTLFIDDINGKTLGYGEFLAYNIQLTSDVKKDFIFGYKNAVYKEGTFYKDVGYFSVPENKFIILKEQYENGRIIWLSKEYILFLKRNSIEFLDYKFDKLWDLSFDTLNIQEVTDSFDYLDFIYIIANEGKVLQINKKSGEISSMFQNKEMGNFYRNYFINDDGIILFLGHKSYMEISPSDFTVLNEINFADKDVHINECFFSKENQCIYFFGYYGDTFPNLIGSFDLKTLSFTWSYVLKDEDTDNYFFNSPMIVGDYAVVGDGLQNIYIFEKN